MTGRNWVKPKAESLDIRFEQNESIFCDKKQKAEKDQVKLTIEEFRNCKGFETGSESEAQDTIESPFRLAVIVYNF